MSTPESPGAAPQPVPPYAPVNYPVQPQYGVPTRSPYGTPPQPQYGMAPHAGGPQGQPKSARGLALTAFILGIAAFVLGWIPFLGLVVAIAAVVLGILALVKKQTRWMALWGTILGAIGLIFAIVMTLSFGAFMAGFESTQGNAAAPAATSTAEAEADEPAAPVPPVEEAPPAPVAPDLSTFAPTDDRTFALIAKDPDAYIGTNIIMFGTITQLDSATGRCNMLVSAGAAQTEFSYDYSQNTLASSGDGASVCPIFDPLVEDDHVKLWVTVLGSYSYDTQIGGNTTVPSFEVLQAELLPVQEY